MTAAPKTRKRKERVDPTPSKAIRLIGEWLAGLLVREGDESGATAGHALHAFLAAHGLQIVEADALAAAEQHGRKLTAVAAAEGWESMRARAVAAEHTAQVLDRAHAEIASQLALAMHWGAELVEQLHEAATAQLGVAVSLTREVLDQREEYSRLVEAERGKVRRLELELARLREP